MCLFAGLLVLGSLYSAHVQAMTPTAYYVLDPDFGDADATVISLEDGNTISAGGTQLYLDNGEIGTIPAADLAQGTRVSGTGAFTLGNSVNGTDLPNPESFAGTLFSIPHRTNSHRYLLLSPDTDARVGIKNDGDRTNITLTAGQVYTQEMGSNNGNSQLGEITSDVPILVLHKGYNNSDARYSYPVPPAALELWGFHSQEILVGTAGKGADVYLYASNGDSTDKSIDKEEWKEINVGDNDSEGRGDAIHVISDEPVSAVQFDDSDGRESTAFFSSEYLATHFALPVDTQYVAVLCTQPNTVITLYEAGYTPDEKTCNANGLSPDKVYFGSSSDGEHMGAGARIEATKPVYLIYEDADTDDEKNLLGFDLWGPVLTLINPGDQTHLETRNVLLQIKAASSDGDPITYSATGLPPGLVIDVDSGLISGQIAQGAAGSYSPVITVDDGISEASDTFEWTITGGNIGIETLFRSGDYWKYLDDGSDQGTAWRNPSMDDSSWLQGYSQFGFGEGDEATLVSYGADPDDKHITTYFRNEFVLADSKLATDLALRLMRDDGAVVYLNGNEVLRSNMSNGTIDYNDHASQPVDASSGNSNYVENIFLDYQIDPAWLVDGVNLLAVEVHLEDRKTDDMSFDLELSTGINLVEDIIPPAAINLNLISFKTSWGKTVITGQAGAAEAFARVTITTATGETVTVVANADGSFQVTLNTDTDEDVSITVADRHGNTGETINVTAVGSTAGSFDVSPQGAGTYTIPLTLPPGIAGMQPGLSLAYNSQTGNGLLGVGWSLQGLSAISRCGTTPAQDGFIDGVDFDANDRFCLDGQRLIAVNGSYGGNTTEYRTEIDSFSKIISYTEAGTSGVANFRVWTKSGQILEYGVTADSRIEATNRSDGTVLIWAVNRVQDTVGNYITTTYTESTWSGEYYPSRIDYTGNDNAGVAPLASVSFSYTNKPDTKAWLAGSSIESSKVMSAITTQVGSAVVRNYNLTYKTGGATGRKRLESVKECTLTACLPAIVFNWQDMAGADFDAITTTSHTGSGWNTYTFWADVNGDGLADWVRTGSSNTQVRLSNGDGTFGVLIKSAHNYAYPLHDYASWADINGDGMADWVRTGSASILIRLSNGDGT
ncbi:MAG: putative Ig domain-containing protein, partial [Gammaproteobacteria bacterium]|nr:putative Ig domain-containing protein [Gammaproteobacteria bacterium]